MSCSPIRRTSSRSDLWRNRYLKHCHEIHRHERTLFLTSTGFDSILGFDLDRKGFVWGLNDRRVRRRFRRRSRSILQFSDGPAASNALHLNNVHCERGGMYISGLRTGAVLLFNGRELRRWVQLPIGVHNARPFRDGVLFNDTEADVVRYVSRDSERVFPVPRFPEPSLTHVDPEDSRLARQAFARGLCVIDAETIALRFLAVDGYAARPRSPAARLAAQRSRTTSATQFTAWRSGHLAGTLRPTARSLRAAGRFARIARPPIGLIAWTSVCHCGLFGKVDSEPLAAADSSCRTRPSGTKTSSGRRATRFTSRPVRSCSCSPRSQTGLPST